MRANFYILRSKLSSFTNMIFPIFGCLEICDRDSLCEVVNSLLMPSNTLMSTLPRISLIVFDSSSNTQSTLVLSPSFADNLHLHSHLY